MYIRKVVHKINIFSKPSVAQSDVPVALLCDSATVCQPLVLSSRSIKLYKVVHIIYPTTIDISKIRVLYK